MRTRPSTAAEAEREAVENSIAVLPFADLSQNADHAYLADGLSETVLHVLSQVSGLTVSARTSAFAFRDRGMTIDEIAGALGVAHVLEGSVQRAGDQLRIIARLIDARTNRELWSGNFDRGVSEIFAIQDEIAREVVSAMQVKVLEDDRERLEDEYQPDLEAYQQYVLGWRELDRGTVESIVSARQRFERAIAIDPGYALAYTALVRAMRAEAQVRGDDDVRALTALLRPLVEKALDLDPTLADAWVHLSGLQAENKQFEEAGRSIQKALEFNPNSAEAWAGYWNHLLLTNRQEEALAAIRKATELDPESVRYQTNLAQQLFRLSRAEEAIYVLRQAIERHPGAPGLYLLLSRYLNQTGRPGEAMWYLQANHRRDPQNLVILESLCLQHWQLWDLPSAIDCQQRYVAAALDNLDAQKSLAWFREDHEEAVRLAETEVAKSPQLWYPKMQLADALAEVGEWQRVAETVEAAFPDLLNDDPQINDWNQWGARRLAEALLHTGQTEQAHRLIDAALTWFERSRKLQAGGWMAGAEDALLYALRGDDQRALDTLERAVDRDWMFYARGVVFDPATRTVAGRSALSAHRRQAGAVPGPRARMVRGAQG